MFECFNVGTVKKGAGGEASGYGNSGVRVRGGGVGWVMGVVLSLAFVGVAMGTV